MKKINRVANNASSVNPWKQAYEDTLQKEYKYIERQVENYVNENCSDRFYNNERFNSDDVLSDNTELFTSIGEYIVDSYCAYLDDETYSKYEDTIDKVVGYDEFAKFIGEKTNNSIETCYDLGEAFIKRHFNELDEVVDNLINDNHKDYEEDKHYNPHKEWEYEKSMEFSHHGTNTMKRLCRIGSSFVELSEKACEQSYDEIMNMLNISLPKIVNKIRSQGGTYDVEDILEEARKDIGQVVINKYNKIDEIGVPSSAIHTFGQDFIDIYYDELTDLICDYLDKNGL